ncbi:MAG TPA: ATP-binding protein [Acidimicrobiales bacterium]|nr:ATP-binding protein [Acidimicrobiales bacterium]
MNAILLSAPTEVLPHFEAAAAEYPIRLRTTTAINRPLLSSFGVDLRAVFALNITRAWSLGRLASVVRGQNRDAVMSLAFAPPLSIPGLGLDMAQRWFARTAGAFIDETADPWAWSSHRTTAEFAPSSASPAAARRFAQSAMREWHHEDRIDDTVLIVSELVTNSIEYSSSVAVSVDLACAAGSLYIAVSDTATNSLPVLRRPGQGTHAGRGLRIVSASATWWGVTAASTVKTVWAELTSAR